MLYQALYAVVYTSSMIFIILQIQYMTSKTTCKTKKLWSEITGSRTDVIKSSDTENCDFHSNEALALLNLFTYK